MSILESLIAPLDEKEFLRTKWGRSFHYAPKASGEFARSFSWNHLNRALSEHRLEYPRLRLELNRTKVDPSEYTIERPTRRGEPITRLDVPKVHEFVRNGATLIVDSVDELAHGITGTAEALTRLFCTHVQVNAYATTGNQPGFGLHWDDHDVFIVQLQGRKRWKVHDFTRSYPLYRDVEENPRPNGEPVWEHVIEAGDVLYIPRGCWHDVIGIDEPTLHLTFGITNPTGITLVNWLADRLRASEFYRQDLPLFQGVEEKRLYATHLLDALTANWDIDIVERFFDDQRAQLSARPHLSFPFAATRDVLVRDDSPTFRFSGTTSSLQSVDGDAFVCNALGREWQFSNEIRPLVEQLVCGRAISLGTAVSLVTSKIPAESIRDLLVDLLHKGFLAAESNE